MSFAAAAARLSQACFLRLAEPAVFSPPDGGAPLNTRAMLNPSAQMAGELGMVFDPTPNVVLPRNDPPSGAYRGVGRPAGGVLTLAGCRYELGRLFDSALRFQSGGGGDDGEVVRYSVRPVKVATA